MLLHLTQLLIEVDCSYVMHKVNEAYCVPQRSAQSPTAEQGDSGTARSLTFIHSAFKSISRICMILRVLWLNPDTASSHGHEVQRRAQIMSVNHPIS